MFLFVRVLNHANGVLRVLVPGVAAYRQEGLREGVREHLEAACLLLRQLAVVVRQPLVEGGMDCKVGQSRAGDDAANLAVSEKMRSQIRGLNQASKNVQNGVSFIQTTEGYLQETTDILQRIRELAVQASNGVYSDEDRMQIQVEVSQLVAEVDRIASSAQFNGYNMLTGRFAKETDNSITFQVGANVDQNIKINIASATAESLGLRGKGQDGEDGALVSVSDTETANRTLATIDEALKTVNRQRADLGAVQNRMEMAAKGINIAAESTILITFLDI